MAGPGHSLRALARAAAAAALAGVLAAGPGPARAQEAGAPGGPAAGQPVMTPVMPIVTLDQERLFESTLFGQRLQGELVEARQALIDENRSIQESLEAEEAELTGRRAEMEPAAFRQLADAFDEKVTAIRAEQEAKTRALQRRQERAQQVFFGAIGPIIREVMRERGALALLDARVVLLAVEAIDVTDEVRARVDTVLGDGGTVSAPADDPEEGPDDGPGDGPEGGPENDTGGGAGEDTEGGPGGGAAPEPGISLPLGTPEN